ncbi:MAG: ABC transporter permease [Desulfitobacteriaceae bacterium]
MKNSTIKSSIATLLSLLILLFIWKAISIGINAEIILPSPEAVFRDLIIIVQSTDFVSTVFATIMRAVFAFIIACIMGMIVGMMTGFSKLADSLARPILIIIMSAPIVSFILLALIWFKSSNVPIFATFLITFPIITINVSEGVKNVDNGLIEMAKVYRVKRWRVLSEIYFPSIASYLIAAVSTAVGLGWKVVVTAEVLSQPQFAIGTSLQNSKIYLETSSVFAWTLIAVILSFIFEILIRTLEKRLFKWR